MNGEIKTLKIGGDLHKQLKMVALEAGLSLQELIQRMADLFLSKIATDKTNFEVREFSEKEIKAILEEDEKCDQELVNWAFKFAKTKKGRK